MSNFDFRKSKDYWLYWNKSVFHGGNEQQLSRESLKKGDSLGCCITRDGDLEIYINGKERAVGWRNVPVDKPLWGVVDMYGNGVTIQSEFYCGELYSYNITVSTCSLSIILKPVTFCHVT